MGEMPLASYPMQIVSADLIGPFVESPAGNSYVLTILDHFTGWAEAYPIAKKSNECVRNVFLNDFFPRHGFPEILLTDNGGEFIALDWRECLRNLSIDHRKITPYNPQCNGRSERFNRTLKELLAKFLSSL